MIVSCGTSNLPETKYAGTQGGNGENDIISDLLTTAEQ